MLPRFRPVSLAAFATLFLVTMLLGDRPLAQNLDLAPLDLARGASVWTPLSAGLLEPVLDRGALVAALLVCWCIASPVEGFLGARRHLLLLVGASVTAYAAVGLAGAFVPELRAFDGAAGALPWLLASVAVFGVVYADTPWQPLGMSPIRGRVLAPIVAALLLAMPLVNAGVGAAANPAVSTSAALPWPLRGLVIVPGVLGGVFGLLFARVRWRAQPRSGKVERAPKRTKPSHLKLVPRDDRLLNRVVVGSIRVGGWVPSTHSPP